MKVKAKAKKNERKRKRMYEMTQRISLHQKIVLFEMKREQHILTYSNIH